MDFSMSFPQCREVGQGLGLGDPRGRIATSYTTHSVRPSFQWLSVNTLDLRYVFSPVWGSRTGTLPKSIGGRVATSSTAQHFTITRLTSVNSDKRLAMAWEGSEGTRHGSKRIQNKRASSWRELAPDDGGLASGTGCSQDVAGARVAGPQAR